MILGSAVVPVALCITLSKANKWGCIMDATSDFFASIIACIGERTERQGHQCHGKASTIVSSKYFFLLVYADLDFGVTCTVTQKNVSMMYQCSENGLYLCQF